jgi:hypothetical protein
MTKLNNKLLLETTNLYIYLNNINITFNRSICKFYSIYINLMKTRAFYPSKTEGKFSFFHSYFSSDMELFLPTGK